jgi:excisionase family DNA binding protein
MSDQRPSASRNAPLPDLTLAEVAEVLQVSHTTAWKLAQRGELKSYKVGRFVRVARAALADYRGAHVSTLMPQAADAGPTVAPTYVSTPSVSRLTIRATHTTGRESVRQNLATEQVNAYTAWLLIDPETMSYTMTKEP